MMMIVSAAAGCGRLNFEVERGRDGDGSIGGDAPGDASGDASVGADLCPTTPLLADDFDDGTISTGPAGTWINTFMTTVSIAENQGRLVVTFPPGTVSNSHAGVVSRRFDLSAACAWVQSPVLPAMTTAAYAYLTIEEAAGMNPGRITIAVGAGVLEIRKQLSGGSLQIVDTIPYDPVAHAWWRVRTDPVAAWETSSDLLTWQVLHQESKYFALTMSQVVIGAGTDAASTNAGTAEFDTARIVTR